MKTIQSCELSYEGELAVEMPKDAEIVGIDIDRRGNGQVKLWYLGDAGLEVDTEERNFFIASEGVEMHPQFIYLGMVTPAACPDPNESGQYHVIETTHLHRAMASSASSFDD